MTKMHLYSLAFSALITGLMMVTPSYAKMDLKRTKLTSDHMKSDDLKMKTDALKPEAKSFHEDLTVDLRRTKTNREALRGARDSFEDVGKGAKLETTDPDPLFQRGVGGVTSGERGEAKMSSSLSPTDKQFFTFQDQLMGQ